MAKQLKPIEGHIAQINAPRFAEDLNMWVMIVKENGKGLEYDPLLESKMGQFGRYFRRALADHQS